MSAARTLPAVCSDEDEDDASDEDAGTFRAISPSLALITINPVPRYLGT